MLAAIEQRLLAHETQAGDKPFAVVGSAMTVAAALQDGLRREVELYVVPLPGSYSAASKDLGPLSQQGVEAFAVVAGLKTYNDARGVSGNAKLDGIKREILRALVGWQPTANADRIELVATEPMGVKKDNFWFICRFKLPAWIQQEIP